eukprot:15361739-Ditylum_brightwellii.AAC.1
MKVIIVDCIPSPISIFQIIAHKQAELYFSHVLLGSIFSKCKKTNEKYAVGANKTSKANFVHAVTTREAFTLDNIEMLCLEFQDIR